MPPRRFCSSCWSASSTSRGLTPTAATGRNRLPPMPTRRCGPAIPRSRSSRTRCPIPTGMGTRVRFQRPAARSTPTTCWCRCARRSQPTPRHLKPPPPKRSAAPNVTSAGRLGVRRGKIRGSVIASEAKQSRKPHQELDCFVASLLAMTRSHSGPDCQDDDMSVTTLPSRGLVHRQPGWLARLFDYKPFLIVICLTPAIGLLLVFLTYPLGLGVWLAFTDTTIGRRGVFVGLENFQYLLSDPLWWNAVFYSVFYTAVATFGKFALGFWLALLLNNHFPFKSLLRAIVLLPWIVPTVLSALAFWWIYDPQFSIISYLLVDVLHLRTTNIDFLGSPWPARFSLIAANIWRGIPFVAISLLAGLQTISPALYEAAMLDGATAWQRFRFITFPMMLPILAIVMTFSIIFTFTDFQLVYAITRGGPVNSTHLLATLAFQRGIAGGELGEGAAIAVSMIPFLVFATLFSYFGLARRKWQQGESND